MTTDSVATYPLEGVVVFSNAVNGAWLATAISGQDGVAKIEVQEGGFVSAFRGPVREGDEADNEIVTVRVPAGSASVRVPMEARGIEQPKRAPMSVQFTWDLVAEAAYRASVSCGSLGWLPEGQATVDLAEFHGCPGAKEVAIAVEAWVPGEGPQYEPSLYGYTRMPYVAGGTVTAHIALKTEPDDVTWFVEGAQSWSDATDVLFARLLPGTWVGIPGYQVDLDYVDGGVAATAPAPSFMELPAFSHINLQAECTFTEFEEVAQALAPPPLGLSRLAGAVPSEEGDDAAGTRWRLLEGDVGDAIQLDGGWGSGRGDVRWLALEPAAPEGSFVAPELAPEVQAALGPAPVDLRFAVGRHLDVHEAGDYGTFLDLLDSAEFHRQERTFWTCTTPPP